MATKLSNLKGKAVQEVSVSGSYITLKLGRVAITFDADTAYANGERLVIDVKETR